MKKVIDEKYCMSSFLAFRYIVDGKKIFRSGLEHDERGPFDGHRRMMCKTVADIDENIRKILCGVDLSNAGLLLSGGMDSAILASYMPKGTRAYTARCLAEGAVDETERARVFCEENGLEHIVVDIEWQDYLESMDQLSLRDGCPVFANEPQVYKLAKKIKEDGLKTVIFGDSADIVFGGYDRLLSKDWTYSEWVDRFTFVDPQRVLRNPENMDKVYRKYKVGENGIDFLAFMEEVFAVSSSGAYVKAFRFAELNAVDPYAFLKMNDVLDLTRIRAGESKYLIRDLFQLKYPNLEIPEKIAMPRAVEQWLSDWNGPKRNEFWENCVEGMSGEQKFLVFSLEKFLNQIYG